MMQPEGASQRAVLPCPACGQSVRGELRLLFDAQTDPTCTAALLDGRANRLRCPACGHQFAANTPLLYHDAARKLAVAQVPAGLADVDTVVGALVAKLLEQLGPDAVDDYLIEPLVVDSHGSLRLALSGAEPADDDGAEVEVDHDVLTAFAVQHDAEPVLELLDLLGDVTDEEGFLATVNENPQLLAPGRLRAVEELAREADAEGLADVAEELGDLASLLRLHTPEDEDEDDLEQDDDLPPAARDLLVAGDLSAAEDFLDRPDPRRLDDARRAVQTVEAEDAERRDGFMEHARLFGSMVDEMMLPATPDELPDTDTPLSCPTPLGVAEEAWLRFVAAVDADRADEVLCDHPDLVVPAAMDTLGLMVAAALNVGDEPVAAHYDMLRNALLIAGVDEE